MLIGSQKSSEKVRFYVKSCSGAYLESGEFKNQEDAEKEMKREFCQGRESCIVKITTLEEVIEGERKWLLKI